MANSNSAYGFYNFPLSVTVNTQMCPVVSATGYPGYPSPLFRGPIVGTDIGAALAACVPSDVAGGEFDGHPFRFRVAGTATTAGAYTLTMSAYQVPASVLGTVTAAGQVTAAGARGTGTSAALSAASTATTISTTTANFMASWLLLWDSVSGHLNGYNEGVVLDGAILAAPTQFAAITQVTSVTAKDLNFMPAFTFGTAGANSILIRECIIERV